jgi:hypothetical protein
MPGTEHECVSAARLSRTFSEANCPSANSVLAFEDLRLQKGVSVNCPSNREELHGLGQFLHSLLPCEGLSLMLLMRFLH